jgi:pyridoxamine 5'-phosphate oxidase
MDRIDKPLPNDLTDPLPESPLAILGRWFEEAKASATIRNHDAMAIATVDAAGGPQVRMVLCRGFDAERGTFAFYTNRESPKASELEQTPRASGVFYWDALARQARISGRVERTGEADSDAYFAGRHPQSQVAAWTSAQSQPIGSRGALMANFDQTAKSFDGLEGSIPRPPFWGGYEIAADRIELWVEGEGRLHDRAVWTREFETLGDADHWHVQRLQP